MIDDLFPYYERELAFLRAHSQEYKERHPGRASKLSLDGGECPDPHVERMIQAFAFLTARIHRRLDDSFPEITEALLGVCYPHLLRPIPSLSVIAFTPARELASLSGPLHIPRGTQMLSRPAGGTRCSFRTCYPVDLWPIDIADARIETLKTPLFRPSSSDTVANLRISLRAFEGQRIENLNLTTLRLFLHADVLTVHTLLEILFTRLKRIVLRAPNVEDVVLAPENLQTVGFSRDEELFAYDVRSFPGYRLLFDYFALPQKFYFVDVVLGNVPFKRFESTVDLVFDIVRFEQQDRLNHIARTVNRQTFLLGCCPAVNLFKQQADSIRIHQRSVDYEIVPDHRRRDEIEVYSVDAVRRTRATPHGDTVTDVPPVFDSGRGGTSGGGLAFHLSRRPSLRPNDPGTSVYITLINPDIADAETRDLLDIELTCTNRDLPAQLPFVGPAGTLQVSGQPLLESARFLFKPTSPCRPPRGKDEQQRDVLWSLISHLNLNHLSLVRGGVDALKALLHLYNWPGAAAVEREIEAIVAVDCTPRLARVGWADEATVCRGLQVTMVFNETQFSGGSAFLFAAVLERFLALYAGMNTFTALRARSKQRARDVASWEPRAGRAILL